MKERLGIKGRRTRRSAFIMLAALCGSALLYSPAQADAILSNLPATISDSASGLGGAATQNTLLKAVGITMGSTDMTFTSMVAWISNSFDEPSYLNGGTYIGGIYSDSIGNPGSLQAAFNTYEIAPNSPAAEVTMTLLDGAFTLSANTSYWFVLTAPSIDDPGVGCGWNRVEPNTAPTAMGDITFDGYRFTTNSGTTWTNSSIYNSVMINASPVPGPASFGLLALAAMFGARRRRRT